MELDYLYTELKKRWDILILSVLFIIFAAYDYIWIVNNNLPPTWDDAWHLMSSINYYRILVNPGFDMFDKLVHVDWYYPPFYKFSTAFLYMVFGVSIDTAIMTNIFYLGILIFSTYGIGKILFNRETGLLAAIIVSIYPAVFLYQHIYLLDLGLTAMVAFSCYLLLRTDNFTNRSYSIIFGAALGMTLLVKWTAVFFIMGPFIYTLYGSFKDTSPIPHKISKKQRRKHELEHTSLKNKKLQHLILTCITAALIASLWYVPNGAGAYKFIKEMSPYWAAVGGQNINIFSFDNISYYFLVLVPQLSFLLTIVFVAGLIYLVRARHKSSMFLILWVALPIFVLTLQLNKGDRYSMPILAAIAVISAFWVTSISNRKTKIAILSVVILLGGFQLIIMASGNNSIHDSLLINTSTQLGNISLFPEGTTPPKQEDWKHEEALDEIFKDTYTNEVVKARGFGYIVVVTDHNYINGRTFEYYNFKKELPFQVYNGAYIGEEMFYANFLNFDYLIIKSGENAGPYKSIVDHEHDYFEKNQEAFLLIKKMDLPDGTTLSIYRNKYLKA